MKCQPNVTFSVGVPGAPNLYFEGVRVLGKLSVDVTVADMLLPTSLCK
jgi:hypothetical protein